MASGDRSVVYLKGGERFPAADSTTRYEIESVTGYEGRHYTLWIPHDTFFPTEGGRTYFIEHSSPSVKHGYYSHHDFDFQGLSFQLTSAGRAALGIAKSQGVDFELNKIKFGQGTSVVSTADMDIESEFSPSVEWTDPQGRLDDDGNFQFVVWDDSLDVAYDATEIGVYSGDILFALYRQSTPIVHKAHFPMTYAFKSSDLNLTDDGIVFGAAANPYSYLVQKGLEIEEFDEVYFVGDPHFHGNFIHHFDHKDRYATAKYPARLTVRETEQSVVLVGKDTSVWGLSHTDIPGGTIVGSETAGEDYIACMPGGSTIRMVVKEL